MTNKVKIKIPKTNEKEVVTLPVGEFGNIKKRFEKIDQILFSILLVLVLSLISIIVSVVGLFLDQMRYNNAAYKEYSEKIQVVNSANKINDELLIENKQNQGLILKQQGQILELLNR